MIHVSRSGAQLGVFEEERVRAGLKTGEFIGTDLGWTEGMSAWRPLSELESFQNSPPLAVAPPIIDPTPAPEPLLVPGEAVAQETGLPWENREQLGFVNALFETIVMVLTRPEHAFTVMKREAGFGDPILYFLIMGVAGAVVSFVFSSILRAVGLMSGDGSGLSAMVGAGFGSVLMLVAAPLFLIIGLFISAGITHLGLMLLGGANRPFETTLRVIAFSCGSASVCQLFPVCGGLIAGVWSVVLNCIGLARAHQTDTWRAVLAVLLPVIVCCGLGAFAVFALIGVFAGAAGWNH